MEEKTQISLLAGIDAGGTTFKCGLVSSKGALLAQHRVPTVTPSETLSACTEFLIAQSKRLNGRLDALGIAAFGPLDIDPASATYGAILSTPKPHWSGVNLRDHFSTSLNVPVAVETDVNAALLAEMASGAATGTRSAAYVTIGTGIGAGIMAGGQLVGKPLHPEFGHIRIARHAEDSYAGACPFHADCLEGLASAPALTARFGDPEKLSGDHVGWEMMSYYLAQACWTLSSAFRPERIVLGGGIMLAPHLLDQVRAQYVTLAAGYLGQSADDVTRLVVTPGHGDDAGLQGGIALARALL